MKQIILIEDWTSEAGISASLSLPVFSALSVHVTALPAMILSGHTGKNKPARLDTAAYLDDVLKVLKENPREIDAIVVGYLGKAELLGLVKELTQLYPQTKLIVDPAMGDHGRLYSGIGQKMVNAYRDMFRGADYCLPNRYEASMLTDLPESADDESLLDGLLKLGVKNALVTGIKNGNQTGTIFKNKQGQTFSCFMPTVPGSFYGTGDLFKSVFAGLLVLGYPQKQALEEAGFCVALALQATDEKMRVYGINISKTLARLSTLSQVVTEF
jgi:pyridoxine kinase